MANCPSPKKVKTSDLVSECRARYCRRKMRIAIFGATGRLGKLLVTDALNRDLQVQAMTRDPRRLQRANEALTVFAGDAETGTGVDACMAGCRLIVSAIRSDNPAACMSNLVRVAAAKKIDRFVFVSRLGVGDTAEQSRKVSGLVASVTPRVRRHLFDEISRAEDMLRTSKLPYLLLRTTWLTDDPPGGELEVVASDAEPPSRVSRANLSRFILRVIEEPGWNRREVTVGTKRT